MKLKKELIDFNYLFLYIWTKNENKKTSYENYQNRKKTTIQDIQKQQQQANYLILSIEN